MNKSRELKKLWAKLAKNKDVENRIKYRSGKEVNIGFVNQYALHDYIPNKWFDWETRSDAKVMIIGQDWGPYAALKVYIENYYNLKDSHDFNLNDYMFDTFSSRTEKFIINTINSTYQKHFKSKISQSVWNDFFFTVAVLFTRQGKHFRGNEFYDEKFGVETSYPYLKQQIEIVKPKIIIAMGGTAFKVVTRYFNMNIQQQTFTEVVNNLGDEVLKIDGTIIIPNFHPASYTDSKVQIKIWKKIWRYY